MCVSISSKPDILRTPSGPKLPRNTDFLVENLQVCEAKVFIGTQTQLTKPSRLGLYS